MPETDSEVAVTYTMTEDDFARMCWAIRRKKILLLGSIVIGIMCLPGFALGLTQPSARELREWLAPGLFLLSLPFLLFVVLPRIFRGAYRRAYWNNPNLQRETTYRFTPRGIFSRSAVAASEIAWEAIVEVLETKDDFIFFVSKTHAHFLPKEVLASPKERQCLRRIVMQAAGDRAKLRMNEHEVQ